MRKFFYKRWAKVCAGILCIISFNIVAASLLGIGLGEHYGIYENSREEFRERIYDQICMDYSITAVVEYESDFGMKELKDTNFRYGVIQTDSLKGLDLNNRKIYEVCNFNQKVTEDMLHIHSFSMGKETELYVGNSLFDSFYVYNGGNGYQETETRNTIEGYYYARDTEQFYCLSQGKLYPAAEDYYEEYRLIPVTGSDKTVEYVWENAQEPVQFNGQTWYLSDIPILLRKDLSEIGTVVANQENDPAYENYYIEDGCVITYTQEVSDTTPYYVLSYVNEPLKAEEGFFNQNLFGKLERFEKQDFFVQAEALMDIMYSMRYLWFALFMIFLILFVVSFAGLMMGAGHFRGEEVKPDWLAWIPYDVFIILMLTVSWIPAVIAAAYMGNVGITTITVQFGVFIILLEEILFLLFCMSTAVRIKQKCLWRNTLCVRSLNWINKKLRRVLDFIGRAFPMLWRAWAVMGALAFLEMIGVMATSYHPGLQLFLWFVEKILLYGLITAVLFQMTKLQKAGRELAAGNLESRLDTGRMMRDFKEHGDNLNNIQKGIQKAVAEQLKSERFKTELITNVSHDIKTPLTSIINYVDLLEKENIDNPSAQEYLEVLSRQSKRLKKLIEDLMEASKASTGNLTVVYENCDAHVMLIQTIGEFEEKLKANQIDLIVQGSDEPFMIQADPRHLWRIFENLMNNICKYAQPCTRAYVNVEQGEQSGRIVFRNISKYALNINADELMERFVRGDSSRNTEGSGLGLSIAKSLTELMQGTFELVVDGDLFKVIVTFSMTEETMEKHEN